MVFNDANRLFQLIEDGVLKAEYIYNDLGQRTRKIVHEPETGATSIIVYHYDQMGYLISETDADGNLIRDYIWTEGMYPMAQIDRVGAADRVSYLHTDHLMTNRLATDGGGTVVWRWEGEAFGNTLAQEIGGVTVNLRFPGQYFDSETGLHYNYYRYYDPTIGRYITSDPIGLAGGLNTYGYAGGNPVNFADPTGQYANVIAGIGIRVIGGRAAGAAIGAGLRGVLGKRAGKAASCLLFGYCSGILGVLNEEADDSDSNDRNEDGQCPVSELDPIHPPETIGDRPDLEGLSDSDLLDWVNNPNDGQGLQVNENGKLVQGNSRAQELIKRANDPNSSITPDTRVKVRPAPLTPNKDLFWDF